MPTPSSCWSAARSTTSARIPSWSSVAISTATSGASSISTWHPGRHMKSLLSSRPAGLEPATPDRQVRVFQSETAEIIDGPRPIQARLALLLLAGMLTGLLLIAFSMKVDRVITSTTGSVVTVEPTVVLGALDQSIIRTIEVGEGQRVKKGELLATLDPTFTTADVGALKAQVASLTAQIGRCKAELAKKPFEMAASNDPAANVYINAQRA